MNWIEEAVRKLWERGLLDRPSAHLGNSEDYQDSLEWENEKRITIHDTTDIILSHAPVIDAEALAEKITDDYWKMAGNCCDDDLPHPDEKRIAAVITSSIDLDITWKDGKAEWGVFGLEVWHGHVNKDRWYWELQVTESRTVLATSGYEVSASADSKPLAIKSCEQALRSIVCGVKS